ncbi:hypothetical protein DQ04_01711010 [Trypanosoma grayi]|uniref:hypothetical protein n=1 Tax=Trypanosoma grayi TaxID=71804 RepID=UPI0004F4720D|nr:hypothetical protein DQ04_01711010 [Trypanosoma grayi]KEG12438.1 hypothetical protein DQ04_01711010 [Trypanosoma grayi]
MEYITITDKKLRKLSMLVPDKDFERFEMAVVALQSCWRGIKMRLLYRKCLQLVELTTLRREAAEVIQYAFRNHLATREDILEKKLRREHRLKVERLTLIQRYLYEKQSVEAFGMQCVAAFQRLIAHIAEVRRRYAAAIRLQAFWRMCMTRIRIHRAVAACQRIQAVWRGHLGRLRARELRTRRRLAEQDRIAMLTVRIRPVQRWWRNVLAVRAGRAVVASRQRDVAAYLEAQESAFEVEWGRIKHLPDVELYMLKILAVFRGFRCRLECAHRRKLLHVLRRFLLRIVWKKRGERQLLSLREVHTQTRMLRRRGEEVTDAALRIQCLVRRWLAWRQRRVLWLQLQWRHNQARVIQRAYRRFVGRRVMAAARMEAKLQSEKKLMEHLMHYSAAKIQATWRMYSEYKRKEEYLRGDRHVFATRIQKAWRAYTAQWSAHSRRLSRRDAARAVQEEHYRQVAAIRIQAAARMFLVRQRLRRRGVSLRPTPAMLRLCARRIQCAWRRHAAYEYVQQLRFSRAYYDQAKINMESLYTYATMIQSFVRGRVINPKIVAARRLEVEQDIIENKKRRGDVIRGTRAVITIQKNLHRVLERRPEPVLPSPEATSEWASDFAPAVASASTAAALPRAVVPVVMSIPAVALAAPPVEPAAPICVTSMTPADATASTTRGEGGVVMTLETAVPLLQRCGRSCLARRDVQTALFAHPRWRSAIDVQRVWRGYRSRQVVEVYYEYCEEEEDEEVSAEGGSFAEGGSL